MKTLSRWGKLGGLMLALPLVPLFFVMEHVGPEGFPEALGCSGSGNSSGVAVPAVITVVGAGSTESLSVATDGFVVLSASGIGVVEPAAEILVEVKTASGEVVPGSVRLLQDAGYTRTLGWQAAAGLEVGAKLSLSARHRDYPYTVQAQLEVVGPPSELSADALAFGDWLKFGHGVGATVTCTNEGGSCSGGPSLSLPGSEETLRAVHISWTPPAVDGFVAWQAHVELPAGAEMLQPSAQAELFRSSSHALGLGTLVFPNGTTDYCAELVVEDLRTEQQVRKKFCAEPGAPGGVSERDYPLASCSEPPTPSLQQAWCETHVASPLCADSPQDPTPQVPLPLEPGPQNPLPAEQNPAVDADLHRSSTSKGCQMMPGAPATGGSGLALALGGLAAAWQRLRRPRRPATER